MQFFRISNATLHFLSQTYNIELTDDDFKMKNFESIDNICEFIMRK